MNFNTVIKIVLILLLAAVLVIPFADKELEMVPEVKLYGVYDRYEMPVFSWDTWFDGSFQEAFDLWLEQNIGLRNVFINIYNQFRFSFFKQVCAPSTLVGEDNVLYQQSYVNAYLGKTFIGSPAIKETVHKMKCIQNALEENGKFFVYVIAPGKASFFPEYLPDSVGLENKDTSNYEIYTQELITQGVNHIDFRKYFLEMKDRAPHPLYPKSGTHWSGYGITLVADSLFKYIEANFGFDLVDYEIKEGELTKSELRHTDDDIEEGLNLAFDLPDWDMYYPEVEFGDTTGKDIPAILDIGDSYNQSLWGFYPFFQNVFSNKSSFWYYYKIEDWPGVTFTSKLHLKERDLHKELEKYQIVMILNTEANLYLKGFGFVEDAFLRYTKEGEELNKEREARIDYFVRAIKSNPDWLKSVTEKAEQQGMDVDQMIWRDAVWMVDNDK
jgi:hypothetical protein